MSFYCTKSEYHFVPEHSRKHVYHHLSDPAHLTLHHGDIYHQYGSVIGRFIFTSLERHITLAGDNVEICGGLFKNPNGAGIRIMPEAKLCHVHDCLILDSVIGVQAG